MFSPFSLTCRSPQIEFCGLEEGMTHLTNWISPKDTLFVASKGAVARCGLTSLVESACASGSSWISTVPSNPDMDTVAQALSQIHGKSFSKVIAIGGGSAIDLAKALSALGGWMFQADVDSVTQAVIDGTYGYYPPMCPIYAVPTTAGTGSEVTQWATIWDTRQKKKYSIDHPSLLPHVALIVPEFTLSMDRLLTASTGLDALSHAMEAFWSCARNPISQALARSAVIKIAAALPALLKDLNHLELREEMALASLLAGQAFSMTRTTACHSISYPLTLEFEIPHGFAVAFSLFGVAQKNKESVSELSDLLQIFGGDSGLFDWISNIFYLSNQITLSSYGVTSQHLDLIAKQAVSNGRMGNNPVHLTEDDIISILSPWISNGE